MNDDPTESAACPTPQPARVVFCLASFGPGGIETSVLNILNRLDRRGFTPVLFLQEQPNPAVREPPAGIELHWAFEPPYRRYKLGRALMRLLAIAQSCDVIVASQEGRATLVAFLAARILSKPIIGHIHFDWSEFRRHVRRRQFAALQRLYPRMTHVVACGEDAGRSLLTLTRVTPQRLTVIPNFIDPTDLHARAAEPIPEALRPILHQPILAGMGRFTLQKGFDILIRAHARLLRQGLRHHLLLLGEGDLRKEYVGLAQSLGVEDTLFMPGFMKNPFPLLRASSVFALPSRFEGLPYALIEAMTLGLPIVSCDCPSGPREMLDHGQYGLLVPVDDDQALSQAILRIMSDDSVRSRLADLSTQRSAWYHADRCLRLWENLLRGVT